MSIKKEKKAKIGLNERLKKAGLVIKKIWERYEVKAVTAAGIILVSIISFEAGVLKGQEWKQDPLIIEKVPENYILKEASRQEGNVNLPGFSSESETAVLSANVAGTNNEDKKECAFVGSKNSNKYHFPYCSYAKRIKEENRVCFSSEEEAKSKGYVPAGCCVGKE